MRIGNLDIRWGETERSTGHRSVATAVGSSALPFVDRTGVFAVRDTEPWWLAVHALLDELEKEMVVAAQAHTGVNNPRALSSLDNSGGVALVRQRLNETRQMALQSKK